LELGIESIYDREQLLKDEEPTFAIWRELHAKAYLVTSGKETMDAPRNAPLPPEMDPSRPTYTRVIHNSTFLKYLKRMNSKLMFGFFS
jgi:hypothetical protein